MVCHFVGLSCDLQRSRFLRHTTALSLEDCWLTIGINAWLLVWNAIHSLARLLSCICTEHHDGSILTQLWDNVHGICTEHHDGSILTQLWDSVHGTYTEQRWQHSDPVVGWRHPSIPPVGLVLQGLSQSYNWTRMLPSFNQFDILNASYTLPGRLSQYSTSWFGLAGPNLPGNV